LNHAFLFINMLHSLSPYVLSTAPTNYNWTRVNFLIKCWLFCCMFYFFFFVPCFRSKIFRCRTYVRYTVKAGLVRCFHTALSPYVIVINQTSSSNRSLWRTSRENYVKVSLVEFLGVNGSVFALEKLFGRFMKCLILENDIEMCILFKSYRFYYRTLFWQRWIQKSARHLDTSANPWLQNMT
jgi:hypothetical protein